MQYFTEVVYSEEEEVSYQGEGPFVHLVAFPWEEEAYASLEGPSFQEEVL